MAVLSQSVGYLYVMAPRTGCTAVGDILCKERNGWWFPEHDVTDQEGNVLVGRKHGTITQMLDHGLLMEDQLEDLFVFTTVRNPFDSLVSLWVKKRTSYQPLLDDPSSFVHRDPKFAEDMDFVLDHTFSEWIERQYGGLLGERRPRHLYSPFLRRADHVMRYERLQADLDLVLQRLGSEPIEIPVLNRTEGREEDYRSFYTPEARRIIETVFAADLERFGYHFEDGPASQRMARADQEERAKLGAGLARQLELEREARERAEREATHWRRQYERVRNHPVVRVLVPGRRAVRAIRSRLARRG